MSGYMKCKGDPPFQPCDKCGAELNANWTIRALQAEIAALKERLEQYKAWHIERSGWCGNCDAPMFKCKCANGPPAGEME